MRKTDNPMDSAPSCDANLAPELNRWCADCAIVCVTLLRARREASDADELDSGRGVPRCAKR